MGKTAAHFGASPEKSSFWIVLFEDLRRDYAERWGTSCKDDFLATEPG
jgi:hypothetical protein